MKKLLLAILLLASASAGAAQRAITDTGEEVLLNSDGTWEYLDESKDKITAIPTNDKRFHKPADAGFLLKSKVNNSGFAFDADKWRFGKAKNNPDAEYEFQLKKGDLYAVAITEGIQVPLEALARIALQNAKAHAPDARINKQEYRSVNGNKVLYMEIDFTIQEVAFTYMGYYYSDDSGSTQLITYTSRNLVNKYKSEVENFLNGLVVR